MFFKGHNSLGNIMLFLKVVNKSGKITFSCGFLPPPLFFSISEQKELEKNFYGLVSGSGHFNPN